MVESQFQLAFGSTVKALPKIGAIFVSIRAYVRRSFFYSSSTILHCTSSKSIIKSVSRSRTYRKKKPGLKKGGEEYQHHDGNAYLCTVKKKNTTSNPRHERRQPSLLHLFRRLSVQRANKPNQSRPNFVTNLIRLVQI